MKVLYFDLDGTVVNYELGLVKPRLANGGFERAIRAAGFNRLICVGNAMEIIEYHLESGRGTDGHAMIRELCQGAFENERWFKDATTWVREPRRRGKSLDLSLDWWYVDDLAERYLGLEGMEDCFRQHLGGRIFVPDRVGDGSDVIDWLEGVATKGASV